MIATRREAGKRICTARTPLPVSDPSGRIEVCLVQGGNPAPGAPGPVPATVRAPGAGRRAPSEQRERDAAPRMGKVGQGDCLLRRVDATRVLFAVALAAALVRPAGGLEPADAGGPGPQEATSATLAASEPPSEPKGPEEETWAATLASEVVAPGALQLEAGFFYEDRAPGTRWALGTPVALRFGVIPSLEARVGFDAIDAYRDEDGRREHGFGDTFVSLKARTNAQMGFFPSMAIEPFLKAPTADESKGLGTGEIDFGLRLLGTAYWVPNLFYTDLSVEFAWLGEPSSHSRRFFYQTSAALLLGCDVLETLTLYSIALWAAPEAEGEPDSVVLSFGSFLFLRRSLALDIGVDIGVGKPDADWGVFLGVLWLSGPYCWR